MKSRHNNRYTNYISNKSQRELVMLGVHPLQLQERDRGFPSFISYFLCTHYEHMFKVSKRGAEDIKIQEKLRARPHYIFRHIYYAHVLAAFPTLVHENFVSAFTIFLSGRF